MYRFDAACACEIGKIRSNNEDNLLFHQVILPRDNRGLSEILNWSDELTAPVLFGIFDGMGGESFGEEASYQAAKTMQQGWKSGLSLGRLYMEANRRICEICERERYGVMGTTAVTLLVSESTAQIMNIGDSKAFLLRDGQMTQLSCDHTDAAMLQRFGIKNRKPRLTQHLGIPETEMVIEPYKKTLEIIPGDQYLLCSDGLTDMVSEEDIMKILSDESSTRGAVDALMDMAIANGGRDNITLVLCRIKKRDKVRLQEDWT